MKKMIQRYIVKIEEKYVFNISLFFWHIIITLSTIAIVVSLFFLIRGILPIRQDRVEKKEYPQEITVSIEEIKELVNQEKTKNATKEEKKQTDVKAASTSSEISEEIALTKSPEEIEYEKHIDSLKSLLPPSRFGWTGRYEFYYFGQGYGNYYPGTYNYIETAFKNTNATDYLDKNKILKSIINCISKFPDNNRNQVYRLIASLSTDNVNIAVNNINLINNSVKHFGTEKTDYIKILSNFIKKNPQEGRTFLKMVNNNMQHFNQEYRLVILTEMTNSFYKYFDNRINLQIKLTEEFAKIGTTISPEYQSFALSKYYELYIIKNKEREYQIQEIDSKYQEELAISEAKYSEKKNRKKEFLKQGAIGLGGGIVLISLIAILLVMLSMQRYLKKISKNLTLEK